MFWRYQVKALLLLIGQPSLLASYGASVNENNKSQLADLVRASRELNARIYFIQILEALLTEANAFKLTFENQIAFRK